MKLRNSKYTSNHPATHTSHKTNEYIKSTDSLYTESNSQNADAYLIGSLINSRPGTFTPLCKIRSSKINNGCFRFLMFLSILIFCSLTSMYVNAQAKSQQNQQTGIANEIIRFHVIANSDSNEDQSLKITVKDTLVKSLAPLLKTAASKEDAREILTSQLEAIRKLAETTVKNNGYNYPVSISLENCYFPLKIYGDYAFPPGYYDALRVQIGRAEGKNWWCVMFPPLCFVDETYSIVDESSGEKLKSLLTDEEYQTLTNQKTPIKIKFKLLASIKKLFD